MDGDKGFGKFFLDRSLMFKVFALFCWSFGTVGSVYWYYAGKVYSFGFWHSLAGLVLLLGLVFHVPYYFRFLFVEYTLPTAIIRTLLTLSGVVGWVGCSTYMYTKEIPFSSVAFLTFIYGSYIFLEGFVCLRTHYFVMFPCLRPKRWKDDGRRLRRR